MSIQKKSNYIGKSVFAKGQTVNVRKSANISAPIVQVANRIKDNKVTTFGIANGFFVNEAPNTWFNVELSTGGSGWVRSDVITMSAQANNEEGQTLINKLVQNDEEILKNLIKSRVMIQSARENKTLTNDIVNQYNGLLNRHNARQNKVKNSTLLKIQTGSSKLYNDLMENLGLSSLKISGTNENKGVGVIPVIVWIIGAVVVAGSAAAVTAAFLGAFKESASDLKITKDLEQALSTLSPEAAQAVKDNLQEQIDQAYKDGQAKGSSSTMFGNIKTLGLILIGAFAADKLLNKSR